jgi:hypothetical protein
MIKQTHCKAKQANVTRDTFFLKQSQAMQSEANRGKATQSKAMRSETKRSAAKQSKAKQSEAKQNKLARLSQFLMSSRMPLLCL